MLGCPSWSKGTDLRPVGYASWVRIPLQALEQYVEILEKIFAVYKIPSMIHLTLSIFHCDLKLENFLVDAEGNVVLTDFGCVVIALHIEGSSEYKFYSSNPFGTLEYVGPEMTKNPKIITPMKLDIWSLGVIFFCLYTKFYPFDEKVTFQSVTNKNASFWCKWDNKLTKEMQPILSPLVKDFLNQFLRYKPSDRLTLELISKT